ncbi:MAG TPA: hypothetical protein VFI24_07030 [Pyrinomonadaceae bacterium]|nr:hypothetical protein [Pyrinomonadaceae bacterium]
MKRFAMTLALMCALSTSILAGDMPAGGKSESPTPPTTSSTSVGDMPTIGAVGQSSPPASSTLLLNVLLTIINLR